MTKFKNIGVKPQYQIWEIFLTRKINFILVIALINLTVFQIAFGLIIDFSFLSPYLTVAQILLLITIFLSVFIHYMWGVYCFFIIGILLVLTMSLKLGNDSNMQLYYFAIVLNIVQLLGRKETRKHMYLILAFFILALSFLAYFFSDNPFQKVIDSNFLRQIKSFNLIMSSLVTLIFIVMITFQNQIQEEKINSMLKEKDILMAEIFHRVKNNMNIITSLLNLKKNSTENEETIAVLEDCRNRVFSMALVHQKIFSQNNVSGLNFGEYTKDLVNEISNSLGNPKSDEVHVTTVPINLGLDYAIPCGLILNELITNSFKHARRDDKPLAINVSVTVDGEERKLVIQDNGYGIKPSDLEKNDSLGIELIRSLSDQIDGKYHFESNNGLRFTLVF